VYTGRHERIATRPAFVEICALLHRRGVAGASVMLGVDGTIAGERTRAKFFSRNRRVPMMVIAVGARESILGALAELTELENPPFATLERVRICKRDGQLLAPAHELPDIDPHGPDLWQKLEVYTSEQARHEGVPLHRALVSRLRRSHCAGATSLRGIWGFHGDHPPHGDRFLQVRRNVPVLTVLIDSPERIAESFEVVDELTASSGLVTSEMVPAMMAMTATRTRGALRLAENPGV
jgi:PII-like signaling protein